MTDHGIAGKAYDLVYGERAATYGHPRLDFNIIANVWTGLLKDKLKDGESLDPYRVALLMTGLKLARLVKSPGHADSRIDTIGYMLTMERLDEPEDERPAESLKNLSVLPRYNPKDAEVSMAAVRQFHVEDENEECGPGCPRWEGSDSLSNLAQREVDKLLGRETAEHSAHLDAFMDAHKDDPLWNPDHVVLSVLRGALRVEDIHWKEGDRVETWLGDAVTAWVYGSGADAWYQEKPSYQYDFNTYSLKYLRGNYAPLRVTNGTYKGLILFKDGVGYGPE